MSLTRLQQGQAGEQLAERYFSQKPGWRIIEKNWRCPLGEIDLIAGDPSGYIVVIEVKSRRTDFLSGWESVDKAKQKKLWQLAHIYLRAKGLPLETSVRFDAAIVDLSRQTVEHESEAFVPEREI
ncbi:MAG: YraN family protein [Elusimicrobiota bacterium]